MIPKYRAWHKELKIMRDVFRLDNIGDETDLLIFTNSIDGDATYIACHPRECELFQWTGMQDKNDVDIYEGDIVRWLLSVGKEDPQAYRDAFVSFDTYKYILNVINEDFPQKFDIVGPVNMEIIGNIYEHQHLLEGVEK